MNDAFTIKTTFKTSDLEAITENAFEYGIQDWCYDVKVLAWPKGMSEGLPSAILIQGGRLSLDTPEGPKTLSLAKMKKGLSLMLEHYGDVVHRLKVGHFDCVDSGILIQFACFGDNVFG